jgi:hypothetical protein
MPACRSSDFMWLTKWVLENGCSRLRLKSGASGGAGKCLKRCLRALTGQIEGIGDFERWISTPVAKGSVLEDGRCIVMLSLLKVMCLRERRSRGD